MKNKTVTILISSLAVLLVGAVVALSISFSNILNRMDAMSEEMDSRLSEMSAAISESESAGAAARQPEPTDILAEIDGEALTYQQVYDSFKALEYAYEDAYDLTDPSVLNDLLLEHLHTIVEEMVVNRIVKELSLTPSEQEVKEEAEAQYDEIYAYYYEDLLSGGESEEDAKAQAEEFMNQYGMSRTEIENSVRYEHMRKAVSEQAAAPLIAERTEERALKAAFDQNVSDSEARYKEDPSNFEFELYFYDTPVYYIPEGYRAVKHLLLLFDDDTAQTAADLFAELSEAEEDEARRDELLKQIDALKESLAVKIAEIQSAIDAGQDFDALIGQYGEDPAMNEGDTKRNGYYVSPASEFWDEEFKDGAMALAAPGEISGPIVSSVGVHFIKYLKDVASGPVPYESVRDAMIAEIEQTAREEAYQLAFEEWSEKLGVIIHDEILGAEEAAAQTE